MRWYVARGSKVSSESAFPGSRWLREMRDRLAMKAWGLLSVYCTEARGFFHSRITTMEVERYPGTCAEGS